MQCDKNSQRSMEDACRSSEGTSPQIPTPASSLFSKTLLGSPAHSLHVISGLHVVPDTLAQTWVLSSRSTNSMALWASPLESFKLNPLFSTHIALLPVPSESINGAKVHPTAQSSESPRFDIYCLSPITSNQSLGMLLLTSAR